MFTILFKKIEDVFQNGEWTKGEITTSNLGEFDTPKLFETRSEAETFLFERKEQQVKIYGELSEELDSAFVDKCTVVNGKVSLPCYKIVKGMVEFEEFEI